MKKIDIHLGYESNLTLSYRFYDNPVANICYERMKSQKNNLVYRDLFMGFGETVESLREDLQNITDKLKTRIDFGSDNIMDLNSLHENFPKYNDIYSDQPETLELLRRFNRVIHNIEHLERSTNSLFQFDCIDDGVDFEEDWYQYFTPYKRTGEMFLHYPHVGKHFLEIYLDNDVDVLPEQFIPTSKVKNTFSFWCGRDMVANEEQEPIFYSKLKEFYDKVSDKMPYEWRDPRLAIGYVPIGRIEGNMDELIPQIANNKYIHSWSI